ncbi:MAG: TolC family protein [Verrucomicrobiales bacterium]|jgi:cobalt-zinc-cadmium efflux system outer membrane protein|nr:TolC family protein [Verrucomicrobiales bacterium]MBP9224052.1 TolC family protein [Verrucomicrobiales bacterium]
MNFVALIAITIALGLVSCAPYQEQHLNAEVTAATFAGQSLNDPGLKAFLEEEKADRSPWGVNRLSLAAVYFQPAVRVARAKAEEASAGTITAGQRPNPQLSFSPLYNVTSLGISPWIFAPQLNVTVETAGKRKKRLSMARAEVEAAQLRVSVAAWEARSAVRSAMLDLYSARESAALLDSEIALHGAALEHLDFLVRAGEAPAMEVTQARLARNRSRLARHDAVGLAAVAREHLAAAIGVPPSAVDAVTLDFSTFAALPALADATLRLRAVTHRSDLLVLLAEYAGSDAALRLEIAKQYPDIDLQPNYEFDQGDSRWGLGIQVELPILNQNRGPIAEAEARRNTARANFEAAQAGVFGEIGAASAAYRSAQAKVHTASSLTEEAAHASDITRNMVDAGELPPLELIRRKIEASAGALALLEARIQAQQAAGQLEAAIQLPLSNAR